MTPVPAIEPFVTVGNVTYLHRPAPPRPPVTGRPAPGMPSGEEATSARRRTYLARCWRRSQLRQDLTCVAVVVGFAGALLAGLLIHDHWQQIANAAHVLIGSAL